MQRPQPTCGRPVNTDETSQLHSEQHEGSYINHPHPPHGLRPLQGILATPGFCGGPQGPVGSGAEGQQDGHSSDIRASPSLSRRLPIRHVGSLQLSNPSTDRRCWG